MKTRSTSLWSRRNLPEDLWPQILLRLPVKSLVRFRCISKSWLALIDHPDFIRSHLALFNNFNNRLESHLLVLKGPYQRRKFVVCCTENLDANFKPPKICPPSPQHWHIVSSIDGLFILQRRFQITPADIMIWNPSLRKTRTLPPSPQILSNKTRDFGLGFDPLTKDYKYIRLMLNRETRSVAVYSLRTYSWRTIEFKGHGRGDPSWPAPFLYYPYHTTVCLRGTLYGLAVVADSEIYLVSFDLSSEMFASIKSPLEFTFQDYYYIPSLTTVDGGHSLAVIDYLPSTGLRSVWVLEGLGGHGNSLSWSKLYTFASTRISMSDPYGYSEFFYLRKNGEMLFKCKSMVTSYNRETREEKVVLRAELHD